MLRRVGFDLPAADEILRLVLDVLVHQPDDAVGRDDDEGDEQEPTISRLTADEIVTVAICCSEPSRTAPISGPTQLVVPPISGIAIELTA